MSVVVVDASMIIALVVTDKRQDAAQTYLEGWLASGTTSRACGLRLGMSRGRLAGVRTAFAHDAILSMELDADTGAPGAAVTVALCGSWEHDPPCPLAPHHSRVERFGDVVQMRVLFAVEPELETEVRHRIDAALADGRLAGPDGRTVYWQLRSSRPGELSPEEADHAERLTYD